jgi:bifunctional UDP-N-acetylglucosamine pyrophosphorylase/glucosamine-1-phosphate N-acetyltransferase
MKNKQTKAIILAAGKGTRMRSDKAKVLHEVFFAPMIRHVLNGVAPLNLEAIVVVTGHQADDIEDCLRDYEVSFARQAQQNGTAHAVLAAEELCREFTGTVLILCGDTPLVRPATLQAMLDAHSASQATLTVMTTEMAEPANYGRIVKDAQGALLRIVEEKDASGAEKKIKEINAGIYCVDGPFLFKGLREIGSNNRQGEFYLTDLVEIARSGGFKVNRHVCADYLEVLGVNSREDLAGAHRVLQGRRNHQLMISGVTIIGPESVDISFGVEIGPDCEIGRNVRISGLSVLGRGCLIGPCTIIRDCQIGNRVRIGALCCLENCNVDDDGALTDGTINIGMDVANNITIDRIV